MEVGDLITIYRKQAKMTIDELSEKSGVPKGTLNKIIGGVTKAPTLDNMKAIARALGKTLADFDDSPVYIKKAARPISDEDYDLLDHYHQLSDEDKRQIYINILFLLARAEQEYLRAHSGGAAASNGPPFSHVITDEMKEKALEILNRPDDEDKR